jgi:TonB family protein
MRCRIGLTVLLFVLARCEPARTSPQTGTGRSQTTSRESTHSSPAPFAQAPFRVGGDVTAPVLIKRVEPEYHSGRRAAGVIVLEAVVTKTGTVRDIRIVSGADDPMASRVVSAVKRWEFRPATKDGSLST